MNTVPPAQRQAVANTFYSDLYNALQKRCQMVTSPLPGTMRMRFALVDAKIPNAAVNTVATYTPYASTAYGLASLAFNNGVGYFAGTATAEGYATDATSGGLLWEAVDKRGGTTALAENTLNTWLDVDHAFQAWSASWPRGCKSSALAGDNPPSPMTILEWPLSHCIITADLRRRRPLVAEAGGRMTQRRSGCHNQKESVQPQTC